MAQTNTARALRLWASLFASALALSIWPSIGFSEVTLILKNSFIEKYKNRATIDVDFIVDHSKGKPNAASKDGDMHVAGRAPNQIGLPTVAEIMNAKDEKEAVKAANDAAGTNAPIKVIGAWRIWNEHGGDDTRFEQGKAVAAAKNSNPDHVFEIHPITSIGGISTTKSLRPIQGYQPKAADAAFSRYENVRSKIVPGKTTTKITSPGVGYNYVKFQMELNEKPLRVSDGALAFAQVRGSDGDLILRKRRMVFVAGTPPYEAAKDKGETDCMVVLGIPRMDLALVSWRTKNAKNRPEVLTWNLPYEIIVVGVYENEECDKDKE